MSAHTIEWMKCLLRTTLVVAAATLSVAHAAPASMTPADVRHLLERSGFAPSPAEVAPWVGLSAEQAVDRLIADARHATQAPPATPLPAFTQEPVRTPLGQLPEDERVQARRQERDDVLALSAWWLEEMRVTRTPLAERMTLFWHNHFATSMQKVRQAQGMYVQHGLLRREALGSFRDLLHGVARDPAMLIYLDGAANRREAPNENFAREVMELFTLGEGHYTEADIREAARAFSGWTVDRRVWQARWRPKLHDDGEKTLLGTRGRFGPDEALDVMLAQPAAATFVASKLWREFVSPQPDAAGVARVAQRLRQSGWRIDAALRELFLSDAFWSPQARGVLVKSPVELTIGSLRQFEIELDDFAPVVALDRRLGQALLMPPNVKGWPGGDAWIDATTLLERKRFAERLFRAVEMDETKRMTDATASMKPDRERGPLAVKADFGRWLQPFGTAPDRVPDGPTEAALASAVLAIAPVNPVPAGTVALNHLRALALDPAYQLK
jgi:uncharacterized protein (DUF1800 family)